MKLRWQRFNIYLLVMAAAVCGCQTYGAKNPRKLVSTLRVHLELSRDGGRASDVVPIYREKPIMVNVDKMPFLNEGNVAEAKVVELVGGYALRLKFDHAGTALLEEYTVANHGRKLAIHSVFGEKLKDSRWLAAPIITRRISDGVLVFTPDATREETEDIAVGLNCVAEKVQ